MIHRFFGICALALLEFLLMPAPRSIAPPAASARTLRGPRAYLPNALVNSKLQFADRAEKRAIASLKQSLKQNDRRNFPEFKVVAGLMPGRQIRPGSSTKYVETRLERIWREANVALA